MDVSVRCPRCWKHVASGARFCPRCGSALGMATPGMATPPVRAPMRMPPKPAGAGGGVTALLVFLVVGAFGLLVMLFVGSSVTPPPMPVPPTPPATVSPEQATAEQDDQGPGYPSSAYPSSGPYYSVSPRPPYPVRPRVIDRYPQAPYPIPDRSHEHERDRDMHR